MGKGKLTLPFSAERLWISALSSPARWLYPLKPGGEQKSADVWQKTVTLVYLDPIKMTITASTIATITTPTASTLMAVA
jgi:hypothetical protein